MTDEDFDIEALAAYLHLSAAQVVRLVERGNLPARKVAGQWRFSQAEIHHWLEERIGFSSEEELVRMEGVLRRRPGRVDEQPISIAEMLPESAIAVPLAARTRGSVIRSMCELAANTGWLWDAAKMAEAVRAREDMLPTALDNGVALLHARRPLPSILGRAFVALGRTARGIPFGAARGTPTDLFFLICSTVDRGHLRTLARLSRLVGDADVLAELRRAADGRAAHQVIVEAEKRIEESGK